jgi:hypothetical protein
MAQTKVTILDPSGGKKTTVEVPDNVPAQRLTQALVTRMGLPAVDEAGHPINYRIGRTSNGEDIELNPDQTFADAGIQDNDLLRFYASRAAGGETRPYDFQKIYASLESLTLELQGQKRATVQRLKEDIQDKVEPLTIPIVIRKEEREGLDFVRADRLHHIEEYRHEETQWTSIAYALFGAALGIIINWVTAESSTVSKASVIVIITFLLLGLFSALSARRFHARAEEHKKAILYGGSQQTTPPVDEVDP